MKNLPEFLRSFVHWVEDIVRPIWDQCIGNGRHRWILVQYKDVSSILISLKSIGILLLKGIYLLCLGLLCHYTCKRFNKKKKIIFENINFEPSFPDSHFHLWEKSDFLLHKFQHAVLWKVRIFALTTRRPIITSCLCRVGSDSDSQIPSVWIKVK